MVPTNPQQKYCMFETYLKLFEAKLRLEDKCIARPTSKELYMTSSEIKVPSQKFPVPKITMQTKSHNLNFNVLSSVVDSSGDEV